MGRIFTLEREVEFPDAELNEEIDRIIEAVNALSSQLEDDKEKRTVRIANTTGGALSPGTLIGFDASGEMALADASDPIIRASFAVDELVEEDGLFTPVTTGVLDVIVGQAVTIGRVGYLSTAAGQAQTTRPTGPDRVQVVGIWEAARIPDSGKAKMTLMIDPMTSRR